MSSPSLTAPAARGYSALQIALHWGVAALVLAQFLTDDAMGEAWRAFARGEPAAGFPLPHILGGAGVLVLVLWRIALRLRRPVGTPDLAEPRWIRILSASTHGLLYLTLIALAGSGIATWFGGIRAAGDVHGVLANLLLVLVALHVAGALLHGPLTGTTVLGRMLRPAPRPDGH